MQRKLTMTVFHWSLSGLQLKKAIPIASSNNTSSQFRNRSLNLTSCCLKALAYSIFAGWFANIVDSVR